MIFRITLPVFILMCSLARTPKEGKSITESVSGQSLLNDLTLDTYAPVYPVLIGKSHNPLLRINIKKEATAAPQSISNFTLGIGESSNPAGIQALQVFYTAGTADFSATNHFGKTSTVQEEMSIAGQQTLRQGNNYFWVSCTLGEKAKLADVVDIRCQSVAVGSRQIPVSPEIPGTKKNIGHALRQHMDDQVHTYRIPGLATTNKGTLIAVYDVRRNGSVDLQEDVDIGMNRSTDRGETWAPMKVIMNIGEWGGKPENENGIGDPSILVDRTTNTIWVAGVWAHGHPGKRNWWASKPGLKPEQTSQLVLVKSEDDGHTWSDPINITAQIKEPTWHLLLQGPGKGITMSDGTLVFPAQFKDHEEMPHSTIIYSKDHGEHWQIGVGAKSNTTEAQVVELGDGSLMLNMRDNRGSGPDGRNGTGARSIAVTKDLGKTWIEHPTSRSALPEPVCMASLIKHRYEDQGKERQLLLFSNPFDTEERVKMTIKISLDEGMTWPKNYYTLIDEGQGRGYSCMTSIDQQTIGILYEGSQADLVFQKFRLEDLLQETY